MTPALKQYLSFKEKYKDAILMFRMGDFYEMFFEDAEIAAKELEIALTSRAFGKKSPKVPMCGVPYHAAESYIAKLVKKGYKVAICEQLEEPKPGKKVVDRGVVRVITPGTYFEDETEDRTLMTVWPEKEKLNVAWCELGTGDFFFSNLTEDEFLSLLTKFKPKELIVPENFHLYSKVKGTIPSVLIQERDDSTFQEEELLIDGTKGEKKAVSALLSFVRETQKSFLPKLKPPKKYTGETYVFIDSQTQKNLELIEPTSRETRASLFFVLDRTKTGMGRRLLKFWILHPLKQVKEIEKRLDAVEELVEKYRETEEVRKVLNSVYDIERLLSKTTSGMVNPRELAALRSSLKLLPKLKELLSKFSTPLLKNLTKEFDDLYDVYCELERVLADNPPTTLKEEGVIKEGVCEELDQLRKLKGSGEDALKEIEEKERKRTGIASLKVGFNNVFGYYIEVSKPNLHLVPKDYVRKQTLVGAERFITEELKKFEEKVLSAQEKIKRIEQELFNQLRSFVTKNANRIVKTAEQVATIDVLQSLATVARERGYVKPKLTSSYNLEIVNGKHPILEKFLEEEFIPNSVKLTEKEFILIVTGPNMGGKSVFLRQTALITLMAQIGSFVPAESAVIGVVDRIFSRVGAADDLSRGLSTFMMEMVETANILKNATSKSLIILDEIGRGTSTYDGMSIARAVVEFISGKVRAKTLFATHYHELTELEGEIGGVKNLHVSVKEVGGKLVFTHKVLEGASERSYGVHVAELAGMPREVIKRAKEILEELESKRKSFEDSLPLFQVRRVREEERNLSFEEEAWKRLLEEIENVEISNTTPLEALMILSRLKEMVKEIKRSRS